ncbi:MAG: alpha/beta hydrolase, partial [Myxococcaceae bacterium]|nr:alpha/beta hydrolase [Myxococcaceae bacterium]
QLFTARGLGFAAVEYPGVGLGPGEPSEPALLAAAQAAAEHLRRHGVEGTQLVLSGQSLGSGVAVALAAQHVGARVLLVSPYTALPDVGALRFPFLPVHLLMRDRFDSLGRAAQVTQPVLLVHGEHDAVIPVAQGKTLAAALPHVTTRFVDGGHLGLFRRPDVAQAVVDFAVGEGAAQPR